MRPAILAGKDEIPQKVGGNSLSSAGNTSKFKSAFGEPPAIKKKRGPDPANRRKQPVAFFDPFRPRTFQNESETVSPRGQEENDHGIQNIETAKFHETQQEPLNRGDNEPNEYRGNANDYEDD